MKKVEFQLDIKASSWAIDRIRSKDDVLKVWVNCAKLMLLGDYQPITKGGIKIIIEIGKISRIFNVSQKQIYSLHFPFLAEEVIDGDGQKRWALKTKNGINIDSRTTSEILSLISTNSSINSYSNEKFVESLIEISSDHTSILSVYRYMMENEDGYLRYDEDHKNAKGKIHPIHHFDIFYGNTSKIKIGSSDSLNYEKFSDIVNPETDCYFLS